MACPNCGAKRGHLSGCPTAAGQSSKAARKKGHSRGLMKGEEKWHICRTCDGDGHITQNYLQKGKWKSRITVCPDCTGSGRINE